MDKLRIEHLTCAYGKRIILEDVSLLVPEGSFVGIVGPNGCGKSTLLKSIYGALTPLAGERFLDGTDMKKMNSREIARRMAVVGQENSVTFNYTVEEIVMMGRTPYKRLLEPDNEKDRDSVQQAMARVGITDLAKRRYTELSGGEKQRVILARALAQETDLVLLDEPTNHLDISYQLRIFDLLRESGKTVLSAIHDLNLALMYCDSIYMLGAPGGLFCGPAGEVLEEKRIRGTFDVNCSLENTKEKGRKVIVYYGGRPEKEAEHE